MNERWPDAKYFRHGRRAFRDRGFPVESFSRDVHRIDQQVELWVENQPVRVTPGSVPGRVGVRCHQHVGMRSRRFGSTPPPKVSFVPVSWPYSPSRNLKGERRASAKVSLAMSSARSHWVGRVHHPDTRTQYLLKCSRELSAVCKTSVRSSHGPRLNLIVWIRPRGIFLQTSLPG